MLPCRGRFELSQTQYLFTNSNASGSCVWTGRRPEEHTQQSAEDDCEIGTHSRFLIRLAGMPVFASNSFHVSVSSISPRELGGRRAMRKYSGTPGSVLPLFGPVSKRKP